MSLPKKDPNEIIYVSFDFSYVTTSISNPTVIATVENGKGDSTPSAIISGVPTMSGTTVQQLITGGVAGTNYRLTCTVTSGVEKFVSVALLPVDYLIPS